MESVMLQAVQVILGLFAHTADNLTGARVEVA